MADTTTIGTQGHFGTVNDRLVAIMTQGHFGAFYIDPSYEFLYRALTDRYGVEVLADRYRATLLEDKYKVSDSG